MPNDSLQQSLHAHLARWGLREFTSDAGYCAWQRQQLPAEILTRLNAVAERKRGGDRHDEIAFYDLSADPKILPVLYSQRHGYFEEIGPRVARRINGLIGTLDFGCGAGILTTFYASRFPDQEFVGVDRSPVSIAVARQKANELGLKNVRFECVDVEEEPLTDSYAAVVCTHALVQAEQDPGIPSASWRTFARLHDADQQAAFELRTRIGVRLDRLSAVLDRSGLLLVCEKTRQLARRVPFQRALAARGLQLIEQPEPMRYRLIEDAADDGPFFVLRKGSEVWLAGNEMPDPDEGAPYDPSAMRTQACDPSEPLYENHWPSAQRMWEQLKDRRVTEETTRQEPDGRQLHVELGLSEGLAYLYCANTFDQRQVVIVDLPRISVVEAYYREIVSGKP